MSYYISKDVEQCMKQISISYAVYCTPEDQLLGCSWNNADCISYWVVGTFPQVLNALRWRQNRRYFEDNIFKYIFLNLKSCNSIRI